MKHLLALALFALASCGGGAGDGIPPGGDPPPPPPPPHTTCTDPVALDLSVCNADLSSEAVVSLTQYFGGLTMAVEMPSGPLLPGETDEYELPYDHTSTVLVEFADGWVEWAYEVDAPDSVFVEH